MTSDGAIHIACAADAAYIPWCAAMLHSAMTRSAPSPVVAHLLHPPELPAPVLDRLRGLVRDGGGELCPTAVEPEALGGLRGIDRFPDVIWYRALLPGLRPGLDRALYLDCDTLVTSDLGPLWETDLSDHYAAAVRNLLEPRLSHQPQAVGIPAGQPYFNSGVLLLNLDAMRRDDCLGALQAHAKRYEGRSIWPDQDSLNFVLGPRCRLVHPRWNCQNSFFYWPQAEEVLGAVELQEALRSPGILHFEGPPETKPWHYVNRHPWRGQYWTHLRATPFTPKRPEGRTPRNVLRRHLPASGQATLRRWRDRIRSLAGRHRR